jgi:hypothetical protein
MAKMKEKFSMTRVVTRDIVVDFLQAVRNLFGMRLFRYEEMISKNISDLVGLMDKKYRVEWWRLSVNPLTHSSVMITIYGEGVKK